MFRKDVDLYLFKIRYMPEDLKNLMNDQTKKFYYDVMKQYY